MSDPVNHQPGQQGAPATRRPRATRIGLCSGDARHKTIKVLIDFQVKHPKYNKFLSRRVVLHVHDEKNECRAGDRVEVMESRPISKTKCWRLVRVIDKAPQQVTLDPSVVGGGA